MSLTTLPAGLTGPQRDRLAYIDLKLRFLGEVTRGDLIARFGVQQAAASRDLALYSTAKLRAFATSCSPACTKGGVTKGGVTH